MTAYERNTGATRAPQERCDIRVWSGECRQGGDAAGGSEYLCATCGTIANLDHEMHHEIFPHVSGDEDNLY